MNCTKCNLQNVVKNGKTDKGVQRFYCNNCKHAFQTEYVYRSCQTRDEQITRLLKESCGIRSIGRLLGISPNTVMRRILRIAGKLKRPYPILKGKSYEVDELITFVQNKDNRICVAYSYERESRQVLDISVGRRCKRVLRKVTDTLVLSDAKSIYTDRLDIYENLIPKDIHERHKRCTNHIERQNLTLRTHLKRLSRRTICFSKSLMMLLAVVKIYFWFV